jgi:hypothetical protein
VKRFVQPKVVYSSASSVDGDLNKNNNMDNEGGDVKANARVGNMDTITAAVAASAAAAATQPFLKVT